MRITLFIFGLCLAVAGQAAIVVTSEGMGGTSTQYFDQGRFITMENGQPSVGIEKDGSCWFIAEYQRVQGRCEDMMNSMKGMREQMMSGMSEQERAMMKQMQSRYMGMNKAPQIKEVAGQRIAGLSGNRCYEVGGPSHIICINEKLLGKVKREMGSDFYRRMQERFGSMAKDMGMEDMAESALARLGEKGYVMKDLQAASPMGMNAAMLQYLPPEQREEIMKHMNAGGSGQMQGLTVTSVNENGSIPPLDLSAFPAVSFDDYMQQMMQQTHRYR